MTKEQIKKTAQAAMKSNYGYAPALREIKLLEASDDRTYILFRIGDFEYEFRSYAFQDGSVWVGEGHVEKTAVFRFSHLEGIYKRTALNA